MSYRRQASPIFATNSCWCSFTDGSASGRYQASTFTASPPTRRILSTDQSSMALLSRPPREEEVRVILSVEQPRNVSDDALRDITWALINTREFLFIR